MEYTIIVWILVVAHSGMFITQEHLYAIGIAVYGSIALASLLYYFHLMTESVFPVLLCFQVIVSMISVRLTICANFLFFLPIRIVVALFGYVGAGRTKGGWYFIRRGDLVSQKTV